MNAVHLSVRYFILLFSILFFSCGNKSSDVRHDSVQDIANDTAAMYSSEEHVYGETGWDEEIVDSIGYYDAAIYSWVDAGNNRVVELRYTNAGERKVVVLTDSIPGYFISEYQHEIVQINGTGSEEIVVRISSWRMHGGAGVTTSTGQSVETFFVFEPGINMLLFHGTNVSQVQNICGSESGPDCETYESGYSYNVKFATEAIILDSLELLGDTPKDVVDQRMGTYQWRDGMFINFD